MKTFNCIFSTGRTGTGYLAQIFGQSSWEKRKINIIDKNLISHEPWNDIPVKH